MFYELKHSLAADYFQVEGANDMVFPSHMHHCFELLTLREGEMNVDVDERTYTLKAGDALMIFPNQIHSLHCTEHSRHVLILFSPKLVSAYTRKIAAKKPTDNHFRPDIFYMDKLEQMLYRQAGILEIKGLLYDFCAAFDRDAVYKEADSSSLTLISNIFRFIELNYAGDCTLSDLVKYTGYDYAYLSKYFKKTVGISFNDYVNQYRISQACYLLQNGDMTVLEISNECGFNSLRSMNRNFKEQMGIPPAEYRRNYR